MAPPTGSAGKGSRQRQQQQQQQQQAPLQIQARSTLALEQRQQQQPQQQQQQQQQGEEWEVSSSSTQKQSKKGIQPNTRPLLMSIENLHNNLKAINFGRSFMSIIGGVVAGVLGLTGLLGLLFYVLAMLCCSLAFLVKAGPTPQSYFDSLHRLTLDGFFAGALSYILFWTLAYDIVHIF